MLIPNILNVAINLFFIYFAVSLLLSALQEQIISLLALRAKNLKSSIITMLGDGDKDTKLLTDNLYQHPLIKSLNQQGNKWLKRTRNILFIPINLLLNYFNKKSNKKNSITWNSIGPSYLNSEIFSDTLLDLLRKDYGLYFNTYSDGINNIINQLEKELARRDNSQNIQESRSGENPNNNTSKLSKLPDELLKNLYALALQTKNKAAEGNATITEFNNNIANWFDESMERATGVYKRNAFGLSLLLGFMIAIIGNIDTIHMINQLYNDPALNETLSGFAKQQIETIESQCKNELPEVTNDCIKSKFNNLNLNDIRSFPIGWEVQEIETTKNNSSQANKTINFNFFGYNIQAKRQQNSALFTIFGWIITAFALAQGAPFWFDLLNNVLKVKVRSSGQRYDSTTNKQK
ncbi:MAG TPA: hypothetical protein DCF68_05995 [Cyanothece sp. UBA12306]|nr:hypothetical protein [Cyanothece sp. UBA12306]